MFAPHHYLLSDDHHKVPTYHWPCSSEHKGNIQLIHGMSEHHGYYQNFITYFNDRGFDIWAHDHRGHGHAIINDQDFGYLGMPHGGQNLINDSLLVSENIKALKSDLPLILFGHSMGALIAQNMVMHIQAGNHYQALILTGTPGIIPSWQSILGKLLIQFEIIRQNKKNRAISPIATLLLDTGFNYDFRYEKKSFAWVTRDPEWLEYFLNDPRAGFVPQNQFWLDLIWLLERVRDAENITQINNDLPILLLDGAMDPINNKTKQSRKLVKKFRDAEIKNIQHIIYPETRHHLCIEINREAIFSDIYRWLNLQVEK